MSVLRRLVPFTVVFLAGIVTAPLLLIAVAWSGSLPVDGLSTPSRWEARIGQTALQASLARRTNGLKNPVLGSDRDLLVGMKHYRTDCAGCHGEASGPSPWGSRNFYPRVPQFAQHPPAFTIPEMFVAVKYGIRYSGMGGWDRIIPDGQIWEIVTFLSRLNSLPPPVERAWRAKRHRV